MTGRAPHNADGTQRTETTKGTDPPQFPNEARKGKLIELKLQDNQCLFPRSGLERMNWNVCVEDEDEGGRNEEMKTRCELREKRTVHLNRKRFSMGYKINTRKIRRIRKSISCLVSDRKGYRRICRGTY
jgi:hypothetical protein